MSLTMGTGPLAAGGGTFSFGPLPPNLWYCEDWPRRVRAVFGGQTVLDSRRGKALHRTGRPPVHYFPIEDLRPDVLLSDGSWRRTWSLRIRDRTAPHAVSPAPPDVPPLDGYVTIDYAAIDRWFEEDDPVYAGPRDPYHRIDVRNSSRHVLVRHHDLVVAESRRPKLLFETAMPVRYYLPFADVELSLLSLSRNVTECPYKGNGQHWHLRTDNGQIADAACSLPHPLPECLVVADHVCFHPNKVQVLVDGEPTGP